MPTTQQSKQGGLSRERKRHKQIRSYDMEMSIPRSIRAEISENGDIRRNQGRYWEDIEATMPAKRNRNHRSGAVQRPRTYAHQDSAEVQRIANHGISQRKEQSDDIRQARKPLVQVWEPTFLGARILCGYGRKK